jgi:hypothetical protein
MLLANAWIYASYMWTPQVRKCANIGLNYRSQHLSLAGTSSPVSLSQAQHQPQQQPQQQTQQQPQQ